MYWNAIFPNGVSRESTCGVINIDKSNYKLKFQFTEGGTNMWCFFNYMQNLMDWLDNN
jgi:hypothetical protein